MNGTWAELRNGRAAALAAIPRLPLDRFLAQVEDALADGRRTAQFFGDREGGLVTLWAVLADDARSRLFAASATVAEGGAYPALTPRVPQMHLFEREVAEQCGLRPEGHPWLKPVRKGIAGIDEKETPYPFFRMEGEEVHEVGVGPVHAGVIEPGHFRFSCHGEDVYHLEIELGFQHRGVEELLVRRQGRPGLALHLAESVAGDTVIGHGTAYVQAMEALGGGAIPHRAQQLRAVALELERIATHLGDLSALANDVAYLTGQAAFGVLRTRVINATLALCGSRFGRGWLAPGGLYSDCSDKQKEILLDTLDEVGGQARRAVTVMFSAASVLARFEQTGTVPEATAREIGLVGPAARASGLARDVRVDHPFAAYGRFPVHTRTLPSGDVFARAYIRSMEIEQSLRIIRELMEGLEPGAILQAPPAPRPEHLVVSMTEGWRGEIVHTAITGPGGQLKRYKITDPSFHNWLALALAVRDNGISDFPLCNKSFNLSYCGFDL